jgi:hypothetical protein
LASLISPVAGSPVRLNATAPTVALFARKSLSAHYNGHRIEAFRGLAGRNTVVTRDERQRNVVRHFGYVPSLLLTETLSNYTRVFANCLVGEADEDRNSDD